MGDGTCHSSWQRHSALVVAMLFMGVESKGLDCTRSGYCCLPQTLPDPDGLLSPYSQSPLTLFFRLACYPISLQEPT